MKDHTSDATIKIIALLLLMVGVLAGLSGLSSQRLARQQESQNGQQNGPRTISPEIQSGGENSTGGQSAQKQGAFNITGMPLKVLKLPPLNVPPVDDGSNAGGRSSAR